MNRVYFRVPSVVLPMAMILFLAGCATPPKNPAEFRAMAKEGGMFISSETYVVKRPFQQVVDTYKQRAPTCLSKIIETNSKQGQVRVHEVRAWKAKVNATNKHMECTLQTRVLEGNVSDVYEYPNKDGHYYMLVDAYPIDQNSTRMVLSKGMGTSDVLIQATRNWADGSNMGCPDMTQ